MLVRAVDTAVQLQTVFHDVDRGVVQSVSRRQRERQAVAESHDRELIDHVGTRTGINTIWLRARRHEVPGALGRLTDSRAAVVEVKSGDRRRGSAGVTAVHSDESAPGRRVQRTPGGRRRFSPVRETWQGRILLAGRRKDNEQKPEKGEDAPEGLHRDGLFRVGGRPSLCPKAPLFSVFRGPVPLCPVEGPSSRKNVSLRLRS